MLQLHTRRWWTIVLASSLAITVVSTSPQSAQANGDYGIDSDYDFRAPGSNPPPTGAGDPDMPSGAPRSTGRSGRQPGTVGSLRGQLAPPSSLTEEEVWTMRLWIALRSLRAVALHR